MEIDFAENRCTVKFPVFSLFFVRFFYIIFQLKKISKNNLLNAPTTSRLLSKTGHGVKDPSDPEETQNRVHRLEKNN